MFVMTLAASLLVGSSATRFSLSSRTWMMFRFFTFDFIKNRDSNCVAMLFLTIRCNFISVPRLHRVRLNWTAAVLVKASLASHFQPLLCRFPRQSEADEGLTGSLTTTMCFPAFEQKRQKNGTPCQYWGGGEGSGIGGLGGFGSGTFDFPSSTCRYRQPPTTPPRPFPPLP